MTIKIKVKFKEYRHDMYVGYNQSKTFRVEFSKESWKKLKLEYQDAIITSLILEDEGKVKKTLSGYHFYDHCGGTRYDIQRIDISHVFNSATREYEKQKLKAWK